jgi:hypothetical protein
VGYTYGYTIEGTITTDFPAGGKASGATVQLKQSGNVVGSATTESDGTYAITLVPAETGYTIEVSASGYATGTISAFDITTGTGNVTGKDLTLEKTYTIRFDSQGGSEVSAITQKKGNSVAQPADPTPPQHHLFKGWFPAANGGSAYNWPYTLDGDVTMYAQWIPTIDIKLSVSGLNELTFSGVPTSSVPPSSQITLGMANADVTASTWYIEISNAGYFSGKATTTSPVFNTSSEPLPRGFYSVNVFAKVNDIYYSKPFELMID